VGWLADPTGKLEVVKSRLKDYIDAAIGGFASRDWRIGIENIGTFPFSTIRIGSLVLENTNYGRKTPEAGCWAVYAFSIHIQDKEVTDYLDTTVKHYKVMDYADDLKDYLKGKSEDSTEMTSYGIHRIYDLEMEYSQSLRRARNVGRMIVTGKILAKWKD